MCKIILNACVLKCWNFSINCEMIGFFFLAHSLEIETTGDLSARDVLCYFVAEFKVR